MKRNMISIDGEKLKRVILKRGMTLSQASTELGFNPTYLNNSGIGRGQISSQCALMLETLYNIRKDEYMATADTENESSKSVPSVQTLDYTTLYKCIYAAVYEAMKKALSE